MDPLAAQAVWDPLDGPGPGAPPEDGAAPGREATRDAAAVPGHALDGPAVQVLDSRGGEAAPASENPGRPGALASAHRAAGETPDDQAPVLQAAPGGGATPVAQVGEEAEVVPAPAPRAPSAAPAGGDPAASEGAAPAVPVEEDPVAPGDRTGAAPVNRAVRDQAMSAAQAAPAAMAAPSHSPGGEKPH